MDLSYLLDLAVRSMLDLAGLKTVFIVCFGCCCCCCYIVDVVDVVVDVVGVGHSCCILVKDVHGCRSDCWCFPLGNREYSLSQ